MNTNDLIPKIIASIKEGIIGKERLMRHLQCEHHHFVTAISQLIATGIIHRSGTDKKPFYTLEKGIDVNSYLRELNPVVITKESKPKQNGFKIPVMLPDDQEEKIYRGRYSKYHKPDTLIWEIGGVEYPIKVQWHNNEIWFLAKNVCNALALVNVSDACSGLDDDEKVSLQASTFRVKGNTTYERGESMLHVNESGLYGLIMKSRKPEAKAFKRWIRKDVLPSIRKYGYYLNPNAKFAQPTALHHYNYRLLGEYIDKRKTIYTPEVYDPWYAIDNKTNNGTNKHPSYFAWYTINWVIRPMWGNTGGDHYIEVCQLKEEHNRNGYDGYKIVAYHQMLNADGRAWLYTWLHTTLPGFISHAISCSDNPEMRKKVLELKLQEWQGQLNLFQNERKAVEILHKSKTALARHYDQIASNAQIN